MKHNTFPMLGMAGVIFLGFCVSALAHHGTAAYDLDRVITVKATITNFYWMNPHCEILFDVVEKGRTEHWAVETHPPTMMVSHGWTKRSLNSGEVVTLSFHPAKNGAMTGILVKVVLSTGQELKHDA